MNRKEKKLFTQSLLTWFSIEKRDLPWRINRTWYRVWVSEIMLQQTQVSQVIPYYNRFLKKFPTIWTLAQAKQQDVLKTWEGLGYYTRARNLHKAAQLIVKNYDGEIPKNEKELLKLPGFGQYTAPAILSLAFNQAHAVVDGNVKRVITRLFTIDDDILISTTSKKIHDRMITLLEGNPPAKFNEAMIELGATVCLPKNPSCITCPVNNFCKAYQKNRVQNYPFKSKSRKKLHIKAFTFILEKEKKFLLVKRPQKGLLAGLWEFPCYFFKNGEKYYDPSSLQMLNKVGIIARHIQSWKEIRHTYTHFQLHLQPHHYYFIAENNMFENYVEYRWLEATKINSFPSHRAMQKIIRMIGDDLKIIS